MYTHVRVRVHIRTYTRAMSLAIPEFLAEGMLRQDPLDRTRPIHPYAESNGPQLDFLSEVIQGSELRKRERERGGKAVDSNIRWRMRFSDFHEEDKTRKRLTH